MDEREWLRRIDARLARGDALMDEVRAEMRRNRESTERLFARQDELITESNGVWTEAVRVLREMANEIRDLRAESRAQREALYKVIDRMDRLDPGGSAA